MSVEFKNFMRSLLGRPLPVDVAMMELSGELKEAVAQITTEKQRKALLARFPDAHLEEVFAEMPPPEEGQRLRLVFAQAAVER